MGQFFESSPQLLELLEDVEILPGLLARDNPRTSEGLEKKLFALVPQDLGFSAKVRESGDWKLFCGGLLYAVDALGPAHAIFQEALSAEGAYWHGMLHRREGDFSNALYWIRRAGRVPGLAHLNDFSPTAFIAECESAAGGVREETPLLEKQRREWEAMLGWSLRRMEAMV